MFQRPEYRFGGARGLRTYVSALLPAFVLLFMALALSPAHAARSTARATPAQKEFSRAVQKGDLDRVKALIAAGTDPNMSISGVTPLMIAKDPEMIRLLVKAGADVNARSEVFKQTVLMWAVGIGKPEPVKALLAAGADVHAKDVKSGMTALGAAVFQNKAEMVRLLLDKGADPNDGLLLDMPLLSLAAMGGKIDVMKALLDGGADVNARNKQGATPLMVAVSSHKEEAVKLLIDAGADANASARPQKRKRKGGRSGLSAMDMAKATGDDELTKVLEEAGAKESEKPPAPDFKRPNPPRVYSLDCRIAGSPPPQGRKFSCSDVGQVVKSGTELIVSSQAFFEGKHLVPRKEGCQVDLGYPGSYTIRTTQIHTPWKLVCRYRLGKTSGKANWIAYIEKGKPRIKESATKIVIRGPEKKAPKEEKEPPSIKIVKPAKREQFVFNDADPGVLEIDAEAEVLGDCDDAAAWTMEDIGESKKEFDPEGSANEVTIKFEGLPAGNSNFGEKKITARACGKSASVTVEVFFPSEKKNHPGKGSGETPNWFYYWGQTKAGRGFNPAYAPEKIASDGSKAVGQYDYTADEVFLTDKIMQSSCAPRAQALGGKESKGIDCFGETVRHETQHKKERWEWWGATNPIALSFIKRRAVDIDGDLVPDKVEERLAGKNCSKWDLTSCDGRPKDSLFDVEMNAYWIGWEWPVGSANGEDWSWCGKQWNDVSVCPGNKRW